MENLKIGEKEKKVFQTGLFDDLTVQDAFTIIALYAAQLDTKDCQDEIEKISDFLNNDALFSEKYSETRDRINKFQNSMEKVTPLRAIEKAKKVLTPELRQKAFMLAARIGKASQEIRAIKILQSLASKLSIEKEMVQKTIDSTLRRD